MKPDYDVVIHPADNGIIVSVGCKTLVFSKEEYVTFEKLLYRYLREPSEYLRKELFPKCAASVGTARSLRV